MIEPIGNRVLVKIRPAVPKDGLVLPEGARDERENMVGDVVSVGPGRQLEDGTRAPMQIRVGDVVLIDTRLSGVTTGVMYKGAEHGVFMEHEIIGIERLD